MSYSSILLTYLIGSIPTAFIIGKLFSNIDIRKHGSGNIGASNTLRTIGFKSALLVLIVDILKGYIPVMLFGYTIAPIAIIGHIFPIFLKFKGGKGVATLLGVIIFINTILAALFIVCFFITLFLSRYASLSSIISIVIIILTHFFINFNEAIILLPIYLLIIYKHHDNIKRLVIGKENKF
jgi:glycerol-3-phosphate acyltransferase PlsY